MKPAAALSSLLLFTVACSRLPALTPEILGQAQQQWNAHRPTSYRMVIEMSGDRVETGRFEVEVRTGQVISLRRNGLVIRPTAGQDYSMEGLFHMLEQELGLSEKPALLGAPEGYAIYLSAKFDDVSGRLIRYRRIVGGASNGIDIKVLSYE